MKAYAITATRRGQTHITGRGEWTSTIQVPTFYLLVNVQGITSPEHAARIAADVIGPGVIVESISAVEVTIP